MGFLVVSTSEEAKFFSPPETIKEASKLVFKFHGSVPVLSR